MNGAETVSTVLVVYATPVLITDCVCLNCSDDELLAGCILLIVHTIHHSEHSSAALQYVHVADDGCNAVNVHAV